MALRLALAFFFFFFSIGFCIRPRCCILTPQIQNKAAVPAVTLQSRPAGARADAFSSEGMTRLYQRSVCMLLWVSRLREGLIFQGVKGVRGVCVCVSVFPVTCC